MNNATMDELLESYANDNIGYVREQLVYQSYSFAEFFDCYLDDYKPNKSDIKLFVRRLAIKN